MSLFDDFTTGKWFELGGSILSGVSGYGSIGQNYGSSLAEAGYIERQAGSLNTASVQELQLTSNRVRSFDRIINKSVAQRKARTFGRGFTGGATAEALSDPRDLKAAQSDMLYMGASKSRAMREQAHSLYQKASDTRYYARKKRSSDFLSHTGSSILSLANVFL